MNLWVYSTHRSTGDVGTCAYLFQPDGLLGGQKELLAGGGGQFHDLLSPTLSHDLVTDYLQPRSYNTVYSAPKTHASLGTKNTNGAICTDLPYPLLCSIIAGLSP